MVEVIQALNGLTWPGAFAFAVLSLAVALGVVGVLFVLSR